MGLGIPIAFGQSTLSTTETSNLIDPTYSLIGPGKIRIFAKASDANTRASFFVNGQKILNRAQINGYGTAGTLDTSANLIAEFNTPGGIPEFKLVATTGTPTVDYNVTFEGASFIQALLSKVGGVFR